jgi:uncharacterized protein (DUF488 family)
MSLVLYTVGYQGMTIDEFVALLGEHGVARVIDVREAPISRKPGFARRRLGETLAEAGMAYAHRPALGTPRPMREQQRAGGASVDDAWFAREYNAHLDGVPEALDELALDVARETCCLLCFEADPARCHRRLIVARLETLMAGQGLVVRHLRAADGADTSEPA